MTTAEIVSQVLIALFGVGSLSAHKAHKGVFITTSELMNAPAFTLGAA